MLLKCVESIDETLLWSCSLVRLNFTLPKCHINVMFVVAWMCITQLHHKSVRWIFSQTLKKIVYISLPHAFYLSLAFLTFLTYFQYIHEIDTYLFCSRSSWIRTWFSWLLVHCSNHWAMKAELKTMILNSVSCITRSSSIVHSSEQQLP